MYCDLREWRERRWPERFAQCLLSPTRPTGHLAWQYHCLCFEKSCLPSAVRSRHVLEVKLFTLSAALLATVCVVLQHQSALAADAAKLDGS